MKRSGIKRKRVKVDPHEQAIRDSAMDERCTLRFELICNHDSSTVVYCHSNFLVDGKGMGLKAKRGCYGCFACHNVLDGRAPRFDMTEEEMRQRFEAACEETLEILKRKGLA